MVKNQESAAVNPFGSPYNTYAPDMDDVYEGKTNTGRKKQSKYFWVNQTMIVVAVLFTLLFVSNGLYMANMRSDSEQSLQQLNKEMLHVQSIASNTATIEGFQAAAQNETNADKKALAEIVANTSNYVKETPLTALEPTMSSEDAAIVVAPYFTLCDSMALLDDGSELDLACKDLTISAYDMMSKVKQFNHMASSFNGTVSWTNDTELPDVAK